MLVQYAPEITAFEIFGSIWHVCGRERVLEFLLSEALNRLDASKGTGRLGSLTCTDFDNIIAMCHDVPYLISQDTLPSCYLATIKTSMESR